MLACAHTVQAVLFVASWWLLGRGLLEGRLDRGWLLGWVLLLLSLIPFRLAVSWMQGLLAVTAGASLRRRLLQGALRVDPQQIRSMGAGRFFGVIAEGGAVEALALSGGLAAILSLLELSIAAIVLWASAGWLPVMLLTVWLTAAGAVALRYLVRRQSWTDRRLLMAERLVEQMIGHRTRLTQQPAAERHRREDDDLERYLDAGAAMDRWAYTNQVILDFSRRGTPTDNATIESLNGRFREECLNVHWFASLEDAEQKIDAFRWDYNENHPHRALKGLSPNEYARRAMTTAADSPS